MKWLKQNGRIGSPRLCPSIVILTKQQCIVKKACMKTLETSLEVMVPEASSKPRKTTSKWVRKANLNRIDWSSDAKPPQLSFILEAPL